MKDLTNLYTGGTASPPARQCNDDGKAIYLPVVGLWDRLLSGDKKIKRLFDMKVDKEGMGQEIMTMLLEGIYFGSTFPKMTEKMYQKAYKDEEDFWAGGWGQGLPVTPSSLSIGTAEEIKVKSLEETERAVLQIVAVYTSKYYPELVDPLGLAGFVQPDKSREQK